MVDDIQRFLQLNANEAMNELDEYQKSKLKELIADLHQLFRGRMTAEAFFIRQGKDG
jgi:hypothetical protein